PQNRWEVITNGSFVNILLRELGSVDLHIVCLDRGLAVSDEAMYEQGIGRFLRKEGNGYVLSFTISKHNLFEDVVHNEIGTDFNNGIVKYVRAGKSHQVRVTEDRVTEKIKEHPNIKQ